MAPFARAGLAAGALLFFGLAVAPSATARTWTNDQGQTLDAEFVRLRTSDRTVLLRDAEGKIVPAPVDRLSADDQKWVDDYKDFMALRLWGDPSKRQRGRFQVLRDDHVEVRMASERLQIPLKELTLDDVAHLEAMYAHIERELPASFQALKAAAAAKAPPKDAVERNWTDARGRSITALYGGVTGDEAVLWIKGKRFEYPLAKLSAADRSWIAQRGIDQLVGDLRGGWSAATSIAAAAMTKAMAEGGPPPMAMQAEAAPPAVGGEFPPYDLRQERPAYSEIADQASADNGYQDPAEPPPGVDPTQVEEFPYEPEKPAPEASPPDATAVDPAADSTAAVPAGPDNSLGPAPWITSCDQLSGDEWDARLNNAFASYPEINYDAPHADVLCSHCQGEYLIPVGYGAGDGCPLCGLPLTADDIDMLTPTSGGGGAYVVERPWYSQRWFRWVVIVVIVSGIGAAVKFSKGIGEPAEA